MIKSADAKINKINIDISLSLNISFITKRSSTVNL